MKRVALKVVLFLLLGAILNVAVAWGCAAWSAGAELYSIDWDGPRVPLNERQALVPFRSLLPPESDWVYNDLHVRGFWRREYFGLPEWYFDPAGGGGGSGGYPALVGITRAGWPMLSMKSIDTHVDRETEWARKYQHAIPVYIEVDIGGPIALERPLPCWPMITGFAINTVFYAAILWLLFAFPFTVRRRRRIKRGLCPACAYPVGTNDVCTECGQRLKG